MSRFGYDDGSHDLWSEMQQDAADRCEACGFYLRWKDVSKGNEFCPSCREKALEMTAACPACNPRITHPTFPYLNHTCGIYKDSEG